MTRRIIGSLKLNPTTSAPTAAKGVMYYNDTESKLKISNDGSTFVTVGGAGGFDAIVAATGGDYTTLTAALAASKKSIFIKNGTYTEPGAIVVSAANTFIMGESRDGAIIQMTGVSDNLQFTASGCTLFNLTFRCASNGHQIIINTDNISLLHIAAYDDYSSNPASVRGIIADVTAGRTGIILDNVKVTQTVAVNKSNRVGIYVQFAASRWNVTNIEISGYSNSYTMNGFSSSGDYCHFANVQIKNMSGTPFYVAGTGAQLTNIGIESTAGSISFASTLLDSGITNFHDGSASDTVTISGDRCRFTAMSLETSLSIASGADLNILTGCDVVGGVTVTGNDTIINGCKVGADAGGGANTITVAAAANRTVITGCRTDAAISDSGTGTSGANNVVY